MAAFIAVAFQLYVPILMGYRFAWPTAWRQDVIRLLVVIAATFVPYIAFYIYMSPIFVWRLPADFIPFVFLNLLVVALPEEIFYRGFLQPKFIDRFGAWPGIIFLNVVFALAHWIGEYDVIRLLPFFPGLVFSYLSYRSRSIASAVVYHALCNILSEVLFTSAAY
jgi:membrane protease YdiL (CAAX protease family)